MKTFKFSKKLMIICMMMIVSFLITSNHFTFASNINMNLTQNQAQQPNNVLSNNLNETDQSANTVENTQTSSNLPTSQTTTSVTNMLPESDLGLANILNILLITVGVILILLAIAILIRLK